MSFTPFEIRIGQNYCFPCSFFEQVLASLWRQMLPVRNNWCVTFNCFDECSMKRHQARAQLSFSELVALYLRFVDYWK